MTFCSEQLGSEAVRGNAARRSRAWVSAGSSTGCHKYRVTFLGTIVKSIVSTNGLIQKFFYLAAERPAYKRILI